MGMFVDEAIKAVTGDVSAPSAGTAAVVTYAAAGANRQHLIASISYSYSAAPSNGNLKIEDGSGNVVFNIDITDSGPGMVNFPRPRLLSQNRAAIVTLAAGGAGVSGKLSVQHRLFGSASGN